MVFFNYALRKLNAKIVYYGPGLCGKTTNLQWIHDHFEGGQRGKMISLSTEGDRTIFFDLLPLEIGAIRGMDVTLQLYTVPGQVHYNSTRQLVLRGADGVVFVADSQGTMRSSNVESLRNLEENLSLQGVELATFPHVLQFNKRDLGNLISVEDLDSDLNEHSVPFFEAVATEGVGVQETLEGIVKLVMRSLRERYEPMAAAGVTAHTGPVPLDVEVPSPRPPVASVPTPPIAAPRPPLSPPMPAGRPRMQPEAVGFEDDVPTRVYESDRPRPGDDERSGVGAGFWSLASERSAAVDEQPAQRSPSGGASDFGFTMPFADTETTTDVSELRASESLQERDSGWTADEAEPEAESIDLGDAPPMPFEVGDLTPEPYTASSVFGGGSEHGAEVEPEPTGSSWNDEVAPAVEAEPGSWSEPGVGHDEPDGSAVELEPPGGAAAEASTSAQREPDDAGFGEVELAATSDAAAAEGDASDVGSGGADGWTADGEARLGGGEEPEPDTAERSVSWPARLRGTVDDLVASVLGTRSTRAADHQPQPAPPPVDGAEAEEELELTPPDAPLMEDGRELEPEPDLAARAWWETPLDEPAAAAEIAIGDHEASEPVAEEPMAAVPTPPDQLDVTDVDERGSGELVEQALDDDWLVEPAVTAADESPQDDVVRDAVLGGVDGGSAWGSEVAASSGSEPAGESEWPQHEDPAESFVADEVVEVTPPPIGERDWYEAHTGEVVPTAEEPTTEGEPEDVRPVAVEHWAAQAEAAADAAWAPDGRDEGFEQPSHEGSEEEVEPAAAAEPEPSGRFTATASDPFDAYEEPEPTPRPRRRPITLGEGDPFGDVVDDEPTPVRAEVLPQVSIATPSIDSLVRRGDNQLHLRLHGSGAIAESGQVRALDIEVPVPGSWVGNQRVTLQLRLTLTPVAEDDDGGPGGSP